MLVSEQIVTRSRRYAVNIGETMASVESMAEDTVSVTPLHIHSALDGNQSRHPYEEGRAFPDPPFPNFINFSWLFYTVPYLPQINIETVGIEQC